MNLAIFYFFEVEISDSSFGHFVGVELNETESTGTFVDLIESHMKLLDGATLGEH